MVTEKFKRNKLDAVHTTLRILLHIKIARNMSLEVDFHDFFASLCIVIETKNLTQSGHHSYNLVSVGEHFGNTGSGHYIVYRRILKNCETSESYYWDGVSDSEVCMVSEEDVLAADGATLLFYRRVSET
ncbi:hypothetical protein L6452_02875 [Arctium lappa]|uniref:Uncharacterized protein n=1 Tax=Arctium lappa TaxID=4217 RepID=A0ACB9FLN6_ARCLA|nr:hypothetical protein L6452_02875 [Arctium lappa]